MWVIERVKDGKCVKEIGNPDKLMTFDDQFVARDVAKLLTANSGNKHTICEI